MPLPEEAREHATAFEPPDGPGRWLVVVDLRTAEEGRSDLSLEGVVVETDAGPVVGVHDVHAL
ncbi:hypothetical protein ACI8AC_00030 [Geodermatophilus sp. SYSU D00758]